KIAMRVLGSIKKSPVLKKMIKGFMIESYLMEGQQDPPGKVFGQSITDPCLGWDASERLVLSIADCL
ncbi:MAG: 3-deoxy-7-phosphoheptulonate synthase, partial [Candidatus Omnitrophota bacterium]